MSNEPIGNRTPESDLSANQEDQTGRLIIFSGPSGVGKTTVLKQLLATCTRPLVMSVSATTRPRREGETEGTSYYYISEEEFHRRREAGEFLETVEVFGRGHWYGTLKEKVQQGLAAGGWVILEIDVVGAQKVLMQFPQAITIFVHPGSEEELERRLRGRATESEESLRRRLQVARRELDASGRYQHIVVNHSVDQTVHDICQILESAE